MRKQKSKRIVARVIAGILAAIMILMSVSAIASAEETWVNISEDESIKSLELTSMDEVSSVSVDELQANVIMWSNKSGFNTSGTRYVIAIYDSRVIIAEVKVDTKDTTVLGNITDICGAYEISSGSDNFAGLLTVVNAYKVLGKTVRVNENGDKLYFKKVNGSYPDYFYQDEAIGKIKEIASSGDLSSNTMCLLEVLLRVYGDSVNTTIAEDLLSVTSDSASLFESSISSNTDFLSLVVNNESITIYNGSSSDIKEKKLTGLYSYLCKVYENGVPEGCTVLSALASTVGTFEYERTAAEEAQKKAEVEAATAAAVSSISTLTAVQKWSVVISESVVDASADASLDGFKDGSGNPWTVANFSSYQSGGNYGSKDSVTSEERLRLKAYSQILINDVGLSSSVASYLLQYPDSSYDLLTIGTSSTYADTSIQNLANQIVDDIDSQIVADSYNDDLVLRNMYNLAVYLSAKVVGYTTDSSLVLGENEVSDASITYSSYLESLIPDIQATRTNGIAADLALSTMTKIPRLAGTEEAYNAYGSLQLLLAMAETYAERRSGMSEENDWENPAIEQFKETVGDADPTSVDTSGISDYIILYTAIADAMNYLGYTPYSTAAQKLIEYASYLKSYEDTEAVREGLDSNLDSEPLSAFFNISSSLLSDDYLAGVALSSTYIPLETNMYDIASVAEIEDIEWIQRFHYPWGFYRKALYIDTDVSSATNYYVTDGQKGSMRIATLQDLLEPEKDIMLYVDDNFYNVDDLAEMQGYTYTKLSNTDDADEDNSDLAWYEKIADTWAEWTEKSVEDVVKTGSASTYSSTVKSEVKGEYGSGSDKGSDYVFTQDAIDKYLTGYSSDGTSKVYNEYTPLQSFAVVSAIYRKTKLYDIVNEEGRNKSPVFVSSPTLAAMDGIEREQWNSIYNYMMLKNLKASLGIDYKSTLDVDSPIYIDIYGNIVTESGLVVIPAASNATLYKSSMYNIYTVGFLSLYKQGEYFIPEDYNNADEFLTNTFELDEEAGVYILKDKEFSSTSSSGTTTKIKLDFDNVPLSNSIVVGCLYNNAKSNVLQNSLTFNQHVYLITEVLRGAPIEDIDKEFEGIAGTTEISKRGIFMAYKLDELADQLLTSSNSNALLSLPNLMFMDGVEYVTLFIFKIAFAVLFVMLVIMLYRDATLGSLGIKTLASFVISVISFIVIIFTIPELMDISYYQANKILLQDEAATIAMLNLEKEQEGREIGVYEITEPETTTQLYLKMEDLSIPWYEILDDIFTSSTFSTISDAYEEEYSYSSLAGLPGIEQKSGDLYMSLDTIFDSTSVNYVNNTNMLYLTVNSTPYASYVSPYYVILENLITRVNVYNDSKDIESYTTKITSKGNVKTMGMIESYFMSEEFMTESEDITGLKYVYGLDTTYLEESSFTEDDLERMSYSAWYIEDMSNSDLYLLADEIDTEAKRFVAENRDMLGKVSDETFLEVMAMTLAVKYNNAAGLGTGSSIEIFDLDMRDLIRLALADNETVMQSSSKSFARFVYDNGGTTAVIAVAFLLCICFVASIVKPACIFIIIAITFIALIGRRIIKRDKNSAAEGFLITVAILCLVNALYAVLLKVILAIPGFGVSMMVSAIMQIVLQAGYMFALCYVTYCVAADSFNIGYDRYVRHIVSVQSKVMSHAPMGFNRDRHPQYDSSRYPAFYGMSERKTGGPYTGEEILSKMNEQDERRRKKYGRR